MKIVLARIDDRLIHGQVATVWSKVSDCEKIIVVSDEVAKDELRSTLLVQVAPPGIKAHVLSIEKAIRVYNNPKNDFKALLLFTNPTDVLRLVEGGVKIESVNIGGMSFKEGKRQVTGTISVNEQDENAFKELNKRGIELEIRVVASDSKVLLKDKLPL
ncbi:mannose/fructose/sorbose PTS transporter subunit IIB [Clostridium sp. 'White wine YQ']|uniref:mannose/fructose/sorbose PTS transporter subunit IIB n=1 Tax=Clostridium sp. 'White wine YQ' TaxID=3027474 RepID=UPI002365A72B|nr:mannose/fructose/sorbose PTS transporter subunit IIB [Clostridium sp. 'White wine YQ']MDD7795716.1 mannose/fructose/sorbose PTS transporter subunit IIB [Clostridium sp. 'White wine YQ']